MKKVQLLANSFICFYPILSEPSMSIFMREKGPNCLSPAKAGRVSGPPHKGAYARKVPKGPAQTGGVSFGTFLWPNKEKYNRNLKTNIKILKF